MLFTTEGLGKYISGAILFEETLYQNHQDGESMVKKLNDLGIIPGIKVDNKILWTRCKICKVESSSADNKWWLSFKTINSRECLGISKVCKINHTIEKTAEVQEEVIKQVYIACQANGVFLEGTLLKPSMTVNGADCPTKADPMKVASCWNDN